MTTLLRSVWDEPRPANPPARVWRDWVLVSALVPLALLEGWLRPDLPWRVAAVIVTVALVPTLLWRRTRPLLMLTVAFVPLGLASVLTGSDFPQAVSSAYLLALPYALFRWGSGREAVIGTAVLLVELVPATLLADSAADQVAGFAVLLATLALGIAFRYRAGAQLRAVDQVKLLERERLARDLHDTVAHHVSAIAIRAQAGLATAATRPNAAVEALHLIEAEASRTLAEMRSMVHVLRRSEPGELTPNPRVADLHQLTASVGTGPAVDVQISGDVDGLPAPVGSAIYRLAQESVTNARRHARHPTRIEVRVAADDTSVRLRVSDDGEIDPIRRPATAGYGLIGMIERADLLGGTCSAGPDPDRGWTVTAELPRTGSAGTAG